MENREAAKASGRKWFPHKKGGPFRKWYGNDDYVVNWHNDGAEAYEFARSLYGSPTRIIKNAHLYFRQGITWSHTSSAKFSARLMDTGYIFNVEGPSLFSDSPLIFLGYLCSKPCWVFIQVMNSTLHFLAGSVSKLPFSQSKVTEYGKRIEQVVCEAVMIAREDWHSQETAWGFQRPLLLESKVSLADSYVSATQRIESQIRRLKDLEEENNRCFIQVFLGDRPKPAISDHFKTGQR